MNFKGIIKDRTDIQTIVTKDNRQIQKITMMVESEERYPQTLAFDVIGDDVQKDLPVLGDRVEVDLNVRATKFNGRWYNSIRAWRITKVQ